MIKGIVKRYAFFICMSIVILAVTLFNKSLGISTLSIAGSSFMQMLSVLPPVMLLLGLMDVWIPRETMIKYMGEKSGFSGIFISILIGSLAAGPMYAAFPFTAVLLKKGVRLSNIIIFLNAWCVTKISTLMFEFTALGYKFTFIRLFIDIPGVILMGCMTEWLMSKSEIDSLSQNNN